MSNNPLTRIDNLERQKKIKESELKEIDKAIDEVMKAYPKVIEFIKEKYSLDLEQESEAIDLGSYEDDLQE